mgnify:CR=1 FL=1
MTEENDAYKRVKKEIEEVDKALAEETHVSKTLRRNECKLTLLFLFAVFLIIGIKVYKEEVWLQRTININ